MHRVGQTLYTIKHEGSGVNMSIASVCMTGQKKKQIQCGIFSKITSQALSVKSVEVCVRKTAPNAENQDFFSARSIGLLFRRQIEALQRLYQKKKSLRVSEVFF